MRPLISIAVLFALQLPLLAGCGSGHDARTATTSAPVARKAVNPADTLGREFVAAVASVKAGTPAIPVQVRFALHEHPQAGQPATVDLALTATASTLDRMSGKVHGEDGLTVVSGEDVPDTQKPPEGTPVRHTVQLLPKQDGIYELTVDVTVDAGGITSTQGFTIPVLAGSGMADLPATGTVSAPVTAARPPGTPAAH
jgi:hypothetical protein